jgi:5-methylcytosine-specific restriction endonuclease McrA
MSKHHWTSSYRSARKRLLKDEEATQRCYYCKCLITPEIRTVDHKIPVARGGEHHDDNLVVACIKCNKEKGTLTDDEFTPISDRKAADTHAQGWWHLRQAFMPLEKN